MRVARPVYNLRGTWGRANAVQLASVQSVWLVTIRLVLGTKLGHLGVSVNRLGLRILLSNGNLFCLFLFSLRQMLFPLALALSAIIRIKKFRVAVFVCE